MWRSLEALSRTRKMWSPAGSSAQESPQRPKSLKELAQYLKLDPSTVSVVLNNVPGRSISEPTRERIRAAAEMFSYQPNLLARSFRQKDMRTIGILLPLVGEEYHAQVLSGIANELEENDYCYLIAQHHHRPERLKKYGEILISRGVSGFVVIDTHLRYSVEVPVVAVAGHDDLPGVTNVMLDHDRAALHTMEHLYSLGHRTIAVIRGQPASSDSKIRWRATAKAAKKLGIEIPKRLVVGLTEDIPSPEHGYTVTSQLLKVSSAFTALVCFNDFAALGAIRALEEARLSVPGDVSVVGFDDIRLSTFARPSITTVRQPLSQMGQTAARLLLQKMQGHNLPQREYSVEPELIIRESTGRSRRNLMGRADRK